MAFKINPFTGKPDYYAPPGVPAAHAGTHVTGGSDVIASAIAGGNAGLMTGADKTKLDGIATGAEVNVNADWNSGAGDSQILNKPTSMTPSAHNTTHVTGGSDIIANAIAGGNAGLMSGADKTKLDGIASGAEVNVNADWNSGSGDSQILNKPTIPTLDYKLKVSTDDTTPNWLSSKIDAGDALGSSVSDEGANEVLKLDVQTQMSITYDVSGLKLSGDSASPGATMLYGTNGSSVKGWYAQPSGSYTDEQAQDAVGGAVRYSIVYDDATPYFQLSGDASAPGANKVYGTDGTGTKGWKSDPAAPAHDLGGASHNADLLANLNAKISDADVVALAGQIGGTAASPDIRGLRETAGPTLLTMGAVADTEYLRRSGSTIVGATPAGGATGVAIAPASNTTISAGYGLVVPNRFTIVDTYYLSVADGAIMMVA